MNLKPDLVDALPYIDQGYEDVQDKQAVSVISSQLSFGFICCFYFNLFFINHHL